MDPWWVCGMSCFHLFSQSLWSYNPTRWAPEPIVINGVVIPISRVFFTSVTHVFRPFIGAPFHPIYNWIRGPPCRSSKNNTSSLVFHLTSRKSQGPCPETRNRRESRWTIYRWGFPKIVGFPPKSSISIGISIINHPFWGTTIFGNTQIIIIYI